MVGINNIFLNYLNWDFAEFVLMDVLLNIKFGF